MDLISRLLAVLLIVPALFSAPSFADGAESRSSAPPVTLERIEIDGPSSVDPSNGEWVSWAAVIHYSDGTSIRSDHFDFVMWNSASWTMSGGYSETAEGSWLRIWGPSLASVTAPLTVTVSHTHEGVTRTATLTVTVTAPQPDPAPVTLDFIVVHGPRAFDSDLTGRLEWSFVAHYSDGSIRSSTENENYGVMVADWVMSGGVRFSGRASLLYATANGLRGVDSQFTVTATYVEDGISRSASVTVSPPAPPTLTSIEISGPDTVDPNHAEMLSWAISASYSDGSVISPRTASSGNIFGSLTARWQFSGGFQESGNSSTLYAMSNRFSATPAPTTLTATYTEEGVTRTATMTITVLPPPATIRDLEIVGPDELDRGESARYSAYATYTDGERVEVIPDWTIGGGDGRIDNGRLTIDESTYSDNVTLTARYDEDGTSITDSLTITVTNPCPEERVWALSPINGNWTEFASICEVHEGWEISETDPNDHLSSGVVSLTHNSPDTNVFRAGDRLSINFELAGFSSETSYDLYMAVSAPGGSFLFMTPSTHRGTPAFRGEATPFVSDAPLTDRYEELIGMEIPPAGLPRGTYRFYAVPVAAGNNPINPENWAAELSMLDVVID